MEKLSSKMKDKIPGFLLQYFCSTFFQKVDKKVDKKVGFTQLISYWNVPINNAWNKIPPKVR